MATIAPAAARLHTRYVTVIGRPFITVCDGGGCVLRFRGRGRYGVGQSTRRTGRLIDYLPERPGDSRNAFTSEMSYRSGSRARNW